MDNDINKKIFNFFAQYKRQQIKKKEIIIRAGDDPTGVFYIDEGIVRQYYISKNGAEITLNMFKQKAFFPMSWTIGNIHNNYYFEAVTDCSLYKGPNEKVLGFLKREPEVVWDLLKRVYIGIEGLWMHIECLSAGNALSKLVSALLILAKRFGKEQNGKIVIQTKITEKELGEYAGMYRETVSREFQQLIKRGLADYTKGIITIQNTQKLEELLIL